MLRSNKGITMTSLVIYVIVLMIVIALMSNFMGFFYGNINDFRIVENGDEQYTRFLAYLTNDIYSEDIYFVKTGQTEQGKFLLLKLKNGEEHQYIYNNNSIYYLCNMPKKTIILCNNASLGNFTYDNNTKILTTGININQKEYNKTFKVDI